jgi:hypothetical protein
VDGALTPLGEPREFAVYSIVDNALEGSPPEALFAFSRDVDELERRAGAAVMTIENAMQRVRAIRDVVMRTPQADPALAARAYDIGKRLADLQDRLNANPLRESFNEAGTVSIGARLFHAGLGRALSTYGPTQTQRMSLRLAQRQFDAVSEALKEIVDRQLPAIEAALDEAGAPWTPGRFIPQ